MKVLFVHNAFFPYPVGGAEHSLLNRCKGLGKIGIESSVAYISPMGESSDVKILGIPVRSFSPLWGRFSPYNKRGFLGKVLWHVLPYILFSSLKKEFKAFVIEKGFDMVIYVNTPGIPVSWLGIKGVRKGVVVADYNYVCTRGTMFKSGRRCEQQCRQCIGYGYLKRVFLGRLSSVVFISQHLRSVYRKSGFLNGVESRVIYNGEEVDNRPPILSSKLRTVGYIGQMNRNKGVEEFLKGMSYVCRNRKDPKYSIILAGDASETFKKEMSVKFSQLDLSFIGKVNKEDFYRMVDLVVVPSLWNEPLGRVPFEAAMRYVHILVSGRGGLKETVLDENRVFEIDSPASLEERIQWLEEMGEGNRLNVLNQNYKFALSRFSTEISAQGYKELIEDEC